MTVVTLTFTGSAEEITSGIPKTMSIESNVPSTVYFTLDGTTPTIDSPIYIDTFDFPTNTTSVTLSAFGVDALDNAGPILTQVFAADTTRITVTRNVGLEGIVVDRAGTGLNIVAGYDADGEVNSYLDIPEIDLGIVHSVQGYLGLAPGTAVTITFPTPSQTSYPWDDTFVPFSTPEIGQFFNPYARTIVIDNRIHNDINIIPRPYGSLNNVYTEFGGFRIRNPADDATYVSGGFVRRFYDARKNVMVSYYFDHNEGRYVKNIQEFPSGVPNIFPGNLGTSPFVFKWVMPGTETALLT